MLIIDKQDIALPTTKQFFVVPKKHLVLFKEEIYIYRMDPFAFVHFDLPHTNASLRMMLSGNRRQSTL